MVTSHQQAVAKDDTAAAPRCSAVGSSDVSLRPNDSSPVLSSDLSSQSSRSSQPNPPSNPSSQPSRPSVSTPSVASSPPLSSVPSGPPSEPSLPPSPAREVVSEPSNHEVQQRMYRVMCGRETGLIEGWGRAGHASQGVPGGAVKAVSPSPRKIYKASRPRRVAYIVFKGTTPGIYFDWDRCKDCVLCISGSLYCGYDSVGAAQRAYQFACAVGIVEMLVTSPRPFFPGRGNGLVNPHAGPVHVARYTGRGVAAISARGDDASFPASQFALPTPLPPEGTPDVCYYVVYKGLVPGVYDDWFLCHINTHGVSNALFEWLPTCQAALLKFEEGRIAGWVQVLVKE
ncbi:hypothetical protein BKA93DRAFT_746148 [Sparassis latifolia]